jgi:Family of unknown function (DUF5335)
MGDVMETLEIPRNEWVPRLNEFTAMHDGWLVSLDVLGPDIGAQPSIVNLPLIGVSSDRSSRDGTISISVARSRAGHFTHTIPGVSHVFLTHVHDGADAAVEIVSRDGVRTIMKCRAPALSKIA